MINGLLQIARASKVFISLFGGCVGAAFMTEDAVKNILGDLPLPKDIVSGLVQNAKGAKKEFSDGVRKEFREYLSKLDLTKLVSNALENYDFNIQATVTLRKKNGDTKSDVVVSTEKKEDESSS